MRMLFLIAMLLTSLATTSAADAPAAPDAAPRRIISLGPDITETVCALGAGKLLVGVSDFCNWPPEVLALPRCGGYLDPNYEVIAALQPDLILAQGRRHRVEQFADSRGIRVLMLEIDTIDQILSTIERLGVLLQREEEAARLAGRLRAEMERTAARVVAIDPDERPKVFLTVSRRAGSLDQLSTVSGASFLGEILKLAGGRNIFAEIDQPYPQVSKESLLARQPEVILEFMPELQGADESRLSEIRSDWNALPSLPATQHGRIHVITLDHALRPGPRFTEVLDEIQRLLYPELNLAPAGDAPTTETAASAD
ncbi:MAG TPA: helical backbone metal receptor [Candidatus Sumerlaeota bacterium]|nr:helical backbone metal receptor [Candidatus Sumerlaeota bacterium]HPK03376.1 helical backbone metal receptor [Candidatus Sumerlaeota bacterium]